LHCMKNLLFLVLLLFCRYDTRGSQTDSLLRAGVQYYHGGAYAAALDLFRKCKELAAHTRDTPALILVYRNTGNVYSQLGQTIPALQAYQRSARIADETGDKRAAARTINNIGALYEEQKDFGNALAYYNKAEAIARAAGDSSILADCANNKGVVYEQQLNYPEALRAYQQALRIYEGTGNEERIGLALNNMGIVYKYLGDYPRAIAHYRRSLMLAERGNNKFLAAANLNNIGNVYALLHDYRQAIAYNSRSLQIAREIKALNIIIEAYSSLAEAHAEAGDYRRAYHSYRQYAQARDSFISAERSEQLAALQTKYETEKKEKEIISLKQEEQHYLLQLARQQLLLQRRNYLVMVIAGIVVLLGITGFLFYSRQQLKQRQLRERAVLDAEYRERMRIARDVHDDLGSGLSRISLMAQLADKKAAGEQQPAQELHYIARVSKELVDNMRDLIWVLNPEHASLDNLVARIREFCSDYLEENGIAVTFDIPQEMKDTHISRDLQRNVFFTVKEAVHNVVKHAAATRVHIRLETAEDAICIGISDNGKGFDTATVKESGNGLRNMRQRMEALGGSYKITAVQGKGTEVQITLSPDAAAAPEVRG